MADAQLPGGEDPVTGELSTPPEHLVAHPEINFGHDQPAPGNAPVQEPNDAAILDEELAPVPAHHHPQGAFIPLLKSLQGHFPPDE